MRILQIGKNDFRTAGGMENYVRTLSEGLVSRGHELKCLFAHDKNQGESGNFNGVEYEALPRFGNLSSLALSPIPKSKILEWAPDIVHLHIPHPIGLQASRNLNAPRLITYHADVAFNKIFNTFYNQHLKLNLNKSDIVVFTSKNMQESCSVKDKIKNSKVIPIGVDPLPEGDKTKSKKFDFIFVGRLVPYKGVLEFLKVLKHTNYSFAIVGSGPLRKKIETQISCLGLSDQVKMLGELRGKELASVLCESKVFVLPSRTRAEAFGIALVEAMQLRLPLLTYKINTGVTEVNAHNENGLVVHLRDEAQMLNSMDLLMQDEELRLRLGEAGFLKADQLYQTKDMITSYETIYQQQIQDFSI